MTEVYKRPIYDQAVFIDLRGAFGTRQKGAGHYNSKRSRAERDRFFALEETLIAAIAAAGIVGDCRGGFWDGAANLDVFGPDAEALFAVMEPHLRKFGPGEGSSAHLIVYEPTPPGRKLREGVVSERVVPLP